MSPPHPQDSLPTPHHLTAKGSGVTVGGALGGERDGAGGCVAVEHPIVEFARRAGADVGGQVGLGAGEAAEPDELVNAEGVGFGVVEAGGHALLPEVVGAGAGPAADAVAPVVAVGEAAAGPAVVGGGDALHVVDELTADAVDVGDFGIAADPDAVVDDGAEVFDEMAVEVGADACSGSLQRRLRFRRRRRRWGAVRRRGRRRCRRWHEEGCGGASMLPS